MSNRFNWRRLKQTRKLARQGTTKAERLDKHAAAEWLAKVRAALKNSQPVKSK